MQKLYNGVVVCLILSCLILTDGSNLRPCTPFDRYSIGNWRRDCGAHENQTECTLKWHTTAAPCQLKSVDRQTFCALLGHRNVLFLGDSLQRQMFHAFVQMLNEPGRFDSERGTVKIESTETVCNGNSTARFILHWEFLSVAAECKAHPTGIYGFPYLPCPPPKRGRPGVRPFPEEEMQPFTELVTDFDVVVLTGCPAHAPNTKMSIEEWSERMAATAAWMREFAPHATVLYRTEPSGHIGCENATSAFGPLQSHTRSAEHVWNSFEEKNELGARIFTEAGHILMDVAPIVNLRPDGHVGLVTTGPNSTRFDCLHYRNVVSAGSNSPLEAYIMVLYNFVLSGVLKPERRHAGANELSQQAVADFSAADELSQRIVADYLHLETIDQQLGAATISLVSRSISVAGALRVCWSSVSGDQSIDVAQAAGTTCLDKAINTALSTLRPICTTDMGQERFQAMRDSIILTLIDDKTALAVSSIEEVQQLDILRQQAAWSANTHVSDDSILFGPYFSRERAMLWGETSLSIVVNDDNVVSVRFTMPEELSSGDALKFYLDSTLVFVATTNKTVTHNGDNALGAATMSLDKIATQGVFTWNILFMPCEPKIICVTLASPVEYDGNDRDDLVPVWGACVTWPSAHGLVTAAKTNAHSILMRSHSLNVINARIAASTGRSFRRLYSFGGGRSDNLQLVVSTLSSLGFVPTDTDDWSILWSWAEPYISQPQRQKLCSAGVVGSPAIDGKGTGGDCRLSVALTPPMTRFVNHIPRIGGIMHKTGLWDLYSALRQAYRHQKTDLAHFIPKAFSLPVACGDLELFVHHQRAARLRTPLPTFTPIAMLKGRTHRMVTPLPQVPQNCATSEGLVQEFVRPMLIDGHAFDVGVYAIITSVSPLRIYVHDEWLVRVTKLPFPVSEEGFFNNPTNEGFVIDDYLPLDRMISATAIHESLQHNRKTLLQVLLKEHGVNGTELTQRMHMAIVYMVLSVLGQMWEGQALPSRQVREFELFRADFIVDENGAPRMMEINKGPNLHEKNDFDKAMKVQLLSDVASLIGFNDPRTHADHTDDHPMADHPMARDDHPMGRVAGREDSFSPSKISDILLRQAVREYHRKGARWSLVYPTSHGVNPIDGHRLIAFVFSPETTSIANDEHRGEVHMVPIDPARCRPGCGWHEQLQVRFQQWIDDRCDSNGMCM